MALKASDLKKRMASFAAANQGAAAVEMALVAVPFFLLMFGIIELALLFLLSTSLENSTAMTARTIRTGEMQTGGSSSAAAFKSSVCNNLGWLGGDCAKNLFIDVRTFATFESVNVPKPVSNGTFNTAALTFNAGGPGDIVVVRAYYRWPFIAPMVSQAMQQMSDGSMLVVATATFRNEPYGS